MLQSLPLLPQFPFEGQFKSKVFTNFLGDGAKKEQIHFPMTAWSNLARRMQMS